MNATDRKGQILAASARCFQRDGFHRTTVDNIAREAGISPALIYRHFSGKVELIRTLTSLAQLEGRKMFESALKQDNFHQALEQLFDQGMSDPEILEWFPLKVEILAESYRNQEILGITREDTEWQIEAFARLLDQGVQSRQIDLPLPSSRMAEALVAFNIGFLLVRTLRGSSSAFAEPGAEESFKLTFARLLGLKVEGNPSPGRIKES